MDHQIQAGEQLEEIRKSRWNRRTLLKRSALFAVSTPVLGAASPTTEAAETQARQGGTLVTTGHHELFSLSPDDDTSLILWVLVTQIHNAMLEVDENFVLQPVLADSFEASDDGKTFTFSLKSGVTFHDGEEFSSKDVKYTFEWYMNPDNAAVKANNFVTVESVDAPDDRTVVVNLKQADATFLSRTATTFIFPAHYHAEVGEDAYKTAPIGTGAFKLSELVLAEYALLEAFEDHFRGRPNLDFFRENVVPEASVRAIVMETGDADSASWQLIPEDNLKFAEDPDYTTFRTPSLAVNHFPLNNEKPHLSDKRVRQAMMYAIDRQKVIDDIFLGTAVLATSNLSPALEFYYEPDVPQYSYDPERAAALLDEAGWIMGADGIREKDGQKLAVVSGLIQGDQARKPEAEVVQQFFRQIGIDMQIVETTGAAITADIKNGTLDMGLFNWSYGGANGEPDASVSLRSDGAQNWSNFKNDRLDELLDAGAQELNADRRKAIYSEIQQIVAEEVPFIFLMYWDWFTSFSNRVNGLPESVLDASRIWSTAYQWSVDEG